MKRKFFFAAVLLVVALVFQIVPAMAYEPEFEVQSKGVYLVNLDTDTVVYEKNANEKMYPASLTKIMTTLLAIENVANLQEEVTVPTYIFDEFIGINISHAGIDKGEILTVEKLLYAMMMQSANEAASIVADYVGGGSISEFVEMMNKKAKEIGANNTHFANPHGLYDDEQYTTPYDMYLITRYAMQLPGFMDYCTELVREIGPTNLHTSLRLSNRNAMMSSTSEYYYEPLRGIKTGTLEESGRCLVSTAQKDGYSYLLVLMGAPYLNEEGEVIPTNYSYTETKDLYEWAFSSFKVKTFVQKLEEKGGVTVELGKDDKDYMNVVAKDGFTALVPDEIEATSAQLLPDLPKSIKAPVEKGDKIGTLKIMLSNEEIGSVDLVASESIERSEFLYALDKVKGVFNSFAFKFVFTTVVVFLVLYIALMCVRNYNKKRYSAINKRKRRR